MKILAADTSSSVGTVALLEDGAVIAERTHCSPTPHNRLLLEMINGVLTEVGVLLRDVDVFAVGIGPGSFTGTRIAVTTFKSFAWALHKPLCGIPSLDALAFSFSLSSSLVCPLRDAKKREVYYGLYRANGSGTLERLKDYSVAKPEKLISEILSTDVRPVIFCGDGWLLYKTILWEAVEEIAVDPPPAFHHIRASAVGALAYQQITTRGATILPSALVPLYVRPSEAELKGPPLRSSYG